MPVPRIEELPCLTALGGGARVVLNSGYGTGWALTGRAALGYALQLVRSGRAWQMTIKPPLWGSSSCTYVLAACNSELSSL